MPKFSQIPTNNSPAIADFMVGVSTGNVDQKTTIAALAALISLNLSDASILPTKFTNPYKFSAYKNVNQAVAAGPVKMTFPVERFDTNNNFDNVTNHRYTIPVSGFYFVNGLVQTLLGTTNTDSNIGLYKNGAMFRKGGNLKNGVYPQHQVVGLMQFTAGDYIEIYFANGASTDTIEGAITSSTFEAILWCTT